MRDFDDCEKIRINIKIVITDPGSGNNRSKFRLENPQKLEVRVIEVDDCVIKQGMRCDYLVITPSKYQNNQSCFTSKKHRREYYDAVWFTRISEVKCSNI